MLQQKIASEFAEAFEGCDLIATPTSPFTAFRLGENVDDPLKMYAADICTVTVNIASLPAMSIPCGTGADGMPIGPAAHRTALLGSGALQRRRPL